MINKSEIIKWVDSIEKEFSPRENVAHGEIGKNIPEQFLATSLRYLKALCAESIIKMNNQEPNENSLKKDDLRSSFDILNAVDLIEDLLNASLDDEEHFKSSASLSLFKANLSKITQDIDQMDQLMDLLRPIIIRALKKVEFDYNSFYKDKL